VAGVPCLGLSKASVVSRRVAGGEGEGNCGRNEGGGCLDG